MKAVSPNCYNLKKLSAQAQTRSLYNGAYFKNVFLTILIAVWNIKVFLIPQCTHPVLTKYILKAQGHVTVNKPVISVIYIITYTWPLCSAQSLVDGVNPQ